MMFCHRAEQGGIKMAKKVLVGLKRQDRIDDAVSFFSGYRHTGNEGYGSAPLSR